MLFVIVHRISQLEGKLEKPGADVDGLKESFVQKELEFLRLKRIKMCVEDFQVEKAQNFRTFCKFLGYQNNRKRSIWNSKLGLTFIVSFKVFLGSIGAEKGYWQDVRPQNFA